MRRTLPIAASILLIAFFAVAALPTASADPWVDCVAGGGRIYLPSGDRCPKGSICWPSCEPSCILERPQ